MNLLNALPVDLPFRDVPTRLLRWWWQELHELLPESLVAQKADTDAQILVRTDGDELVCYVVDSGTTSQVGRIPDTTTSESEHKAFVAGIQDHLAHSTAAKLVLSRSQVLCQLVSLPIAARENLREVLGYEMDRQTPFRADQVYFDYQIADYSADSDQLAVELIAAPRMTVDPLLVRLAACGITLDSVEVESARKGLPSFQDRRINLLPAARRNARKRRLSPTNAKLLGVALALLAIALVLPITGTTQAESRLEAEIEAIQAAADQAVALHERLQSRVRATDALLRLKEASPPVVEIVAELARVLPDHTWLNMLDLRGSVLQIRGQSGAASELIGLIEALPLFRSVSFASPVTLDERARKERFEIQAELVTDGDST